MFTELCYLHIFNMNRAILFIKDVFQAYTPLYLEIKSTKNGFAGPKGFRGFRETGPREGCSMGLSVNGGAYVREGS